MPFAKEYPEDQVKNYGTLAIKLPMNVGNDTTANNVFNLSRTTEEQAVSNYINLLLTNPGERFMQPNYGVGLRREVFQNMGPGYKIYIQNLIKDGANRWLPYIINDEIDVKTIEELGKVEIKIHFRVTEQGANRIIKIISGIDDVNSDFELEIG